MTAHSTKVKKKTGILRKARQLIKDAIVCWNYLYPAKEFGKDNNEERRNEIIATGWYASRTFLRLASLGTFCKWYAMRTLRINKKGGKPPFLWIKKNLIFYQALLLQAQQVWRLLLWAPLGLQVQPPQEQAEFLALPL